MPISAVYRGGTGKNPHPNCFHFKWCDKVTADKYSSSRMGIRMGIHLYGNV